MMKQEHLQMYRFAWLHVCVSCCAKIVEHLTVTGWLVCMSVLSLVCHHHRQLNRGVGYGLEIPCVYRLYDPIVYVDKMKMFTDTLRETGLV